MERIFHIRLVNGMAGFDGKPKRKAGYNSSICRRRSSVGTGDLAGGVARVSFRLLFFGVSGQSQASPVAIDLPSGFRCDLHEILGGFPEALVEGVCEKDPSSRKQICVDSFPAAASCMSRHGIRAASKHRTGLRNTQPSRSLTDSRLLCPATGIPCKSYSSRSFYCPLAHPV